MKIVKAVSLLKSVPGGSDQTNFMSKFSKAGDDFPNVDDRPLMERKVFECDVKDLHFRDLTRLQNFMNFLSQLSPFEHLVQKKSSESDSPLIDLSDLFNVFSPIGFFFDDLSILLGGFT